MTSIEESIAADEENDGIEEKESTEQPTNVEEEKATKSLFKYLLVTGHNDSTIKIWNENVKTIQGKRIKLHLYTQKFLYNSRVNW